ncbi:molybdopterin cofactor-binding domain-containing protein [Bradyrhizobium sp. ISRA463]|uniref:molybdopterin cofactor-binding domain-containing protein n=1 Tax=Bradyrhizobium sp. ISRA463 TaxID=2866199 RepID=UPI00247ACCB6|nr:molybdopterin cofactor-binding domain-containing protein [Bradyrhizobium sp. ISRA463]WGS20543.1 molybdopterin-dependent oxidoreductase [Bradyrhizobium sp. ISRA463]
MNAPVILDRRSVLAGGGALIISFALRPAAAQEQRAGSRPKLPGSLATSPYLDSWIRIDADGRITAFTGKAELGQGFRTAFQQIAAEQLDVPFDALKVITADTRLTANEGYTAGSHSMQDSGTAILNAAAQARALLIAEAARRFGLPRRRVADGECGGRRARRSAAELWRACRREHPARPGAAGVEP